MGVQSSMTNQQSVPCRHISISIVLAPQVFRISRKYNPELKSRIVSFIFLLMASSHCFYWYLGLINYCKLSYAKIMTCNDSCKLESSVSVTRELCAGSFLLPLPSDKFLCCRTTIDMHSQRQFPKSRFYH